VPKAGVLRPEAIFYPIDNQQYIKRELKEKYSIK
jgi:hypothetical protein